MMDILGAIAIGTETYGSDVSTRISRSHHIILPEIYRHVICMGIYQIVVMLILMYFGGYMFFDETFNLITTPLRDEEQHYTARL